MNSTIRFEGSEMNRKLLMGHPSGLFVLFFTEMWERFSYYGMRAILVLFLTSAITGDNPGWGWSRENALGLYGTYTMLVYFTPIIGGVLADKLLGYRWAVALGAKFWSTRGGFKTTVISTTKIGQVHFMYSGDKTTLETYFDNQKSELYKATASITKNMEKRGGGILDIELVDKTDKLDNYYQLHVTFETKDSMGANFINSCLEAMANQFRRDDIEIVMSILSNYVPECIVKAEVSCKIEDLGGDNPKKFARKFEQAVKIAQIEPYRAVTHNKGIMNGIDAVVLATGNDFRAIEAGAHAYASKSGQYKSLTHCEVKDGIFKFWIEIPLAVGTVGGLTALHPMAKLSLDMMQRPSSKELMEIMATAGLAQNFAALRALTTKGIQHGHMKMHLQNILNQLEATVKEKEDITTYFENRTVSHSAVVDKFNELRK